MKLTSTHKFLLVVGLQALVIVGIVFMRIVMFGSATDVLLKINPVDPTDPLRGDYVVFTYDISVVDGYAADDLSNSKVGDRVYVVLGEKNPYMNLQESRTYNDSEGIAEKFLTINNVEKVSLSKPKSGELFIEGTLKDFVPSRFPMSQTGLQILSLNVVNIEYGIEQYFIPERSGRNLFFENTQNVFAHVKITDDGKAQIEAIYKDGKKWPPKK